MKTLVYILLILNLSLFSYAESGDFLESCDKLIDSHATRVSLQLSNLEGDINGDDFRSQPVAYLKYYGDIETSYTIPLVAELIIAYDFLEKDKVDPVTGAIGVVTEKIQRRILGLKYFKHTKRCDLVFSVVDDPN